MAEIAAEEAAAAAAAGSTLPSLPVSLVGAWMTHSTVAALLLLPDEPMLSTVSSLNGLLLS